MSGSKLLKFFHWPFLVLFGVILLSGLSLYQIFEFGSQKDRQYQQELKVEQEELKHLTELLSLRNQLKLKLGEVLFHNEISFQQRTFKELAEIREKIVEQSERLQTLSDSQAEHALIERHAEVLELGIASQFYYQDLVLDFGTHEEARAFYHSEVRPMQDYADGILSGYYELVKSELKSLNEEYEAARNEINRTFEQSIFVMTALLLLMGALVLWFARLVRGRFANYAEDLEREVENRTRDLNTSMVELEKERNSAERANRAKSEFLASMSHELRTPLNSVLGFAQVLNYDDSLNADHKESVHEIEKAGRHLLTLIDDVLDLAKIESGSIDLSMEPVEVVQVVEESLRLIQPLAEKRTITLQSFAAKPVFVRADRVRLKQILLNLLSNAVKYNVKQGRVAVSLIAPEGASFVRLEVCDSGIGIDEEKREQLFQPFNRLGLEGGTIEGSGVGLSITKTLVELMGGKVTYRPNDPQGSCFTITLSADSDVNEGRSAHSRNSAVTELAGEVSGEGRSKTVLYIEDNLANLKLVNHILSKYEPVRLLSAHEPHLGLELAERHIPDVILLDINMPGMDGYQVLQGLRRKPELAHTPILALTACAMIDQQQQAEQVGFDDFIAKPIDVERFLSMLHRYLD